MTARRSRHPRRGVSLIEVLLSLAIFLMSLAAISALVDVGTDRGLDTVIQNTGTRLAQSKLAEVEAGLISPAGGGSGTFDDEPGWQWAVESGSSPATNVYPVTVRVWKEVRGVRREVTLTQMVFDAEQMGTSAEAVNPTTTSGTSGTTSGGTGP